MLGIGVVVVTVVLVAVVDVLVVLVAVWVIVVVSVVEVAVVVEVVEVVVEVVTITDEDPPSFIVTFPPIWQPKMYTILCKRYRRASSLVEIVLLSL